MRTRWFMRDFTRRLAQLRGIKCEEVRAVEYQEAPTDELYPIGTSIRFADGTDLEAQFWRLVKGGRPLVSIFDHRQQYGLPAPIDALRILNDELSGKQVSEAAMDPTTGDLNFRFEDEIALQVFNFTGFEIWELRFPDGTGQLSNYVLADWRQEIDMPQ
jgi:hypothetical protein